MKSRVAKIVVGRIAGMMVGLAAIAAAACVDLSAPKSSPSSISLVQVPELFIVRGDVMRDTNGTPTPASVIAYDASSNPVTGYTPTFFATDSVHLISIGTDGSLSAGPTTGIAHLIGQINNVQTPATQIFVTVKPTTLVRASTPASGDTLQMIFAQDSAGSIATFALAVAVRGGTGAPSDSGVGGAIVRYRLVSAPLASRTSALASYIGDESTRNPTTTDTTDATGNASRALIVNSKMVADAALLAGTRIDSLTVEATMKYRGVPLAGSPFRFSVKIRGFRPQ